MNKNDSVLLLTTSVSTSAAIVFPFERTTTGMTNVL